MADKEVNGTRILARVIIEMLGAPKDHIENTLKEYVEKLKSDKDIEIIKEEFAEAKEQGKLFSTFAELDIWFNDSVKLIDFCFDAMPSSVDILEPTKIILESKLLSDTLNDLQAKIHRNDMIIKTLRARNTVLDKNGKNLLKNFVIFQIKDEEKDLSEIAKGLGMKTEGVKPFLDELIKEEKIVEKEGRYGKTESGTQKEG